MEQAKPTLLEPVMAAEITVPDEFAGSIMGDLNSRRGPHPGHGQQRRQHGSESRSANVRNANLRGRFNLNDAKAEAASTWKCITYDAVPGLLQEKIIEKAKAARGDVKEEEE